MKRTITIEGMNCNHCAMRVQNALAAVTGVASANVDLESKLATVELSSDVDDSVFAAAIEEAGYTMAASRA